MEELIARFELLRMTGCTSKQLDNDMYRRDIQILLALNGLYEERQSKWRTLEMSRLLVGDK